MNLGFNYGALLSDPKKRLQGKGTRIRHIKIENAGELKAPEVVELIPAVRPSEFLVRLAANLQPLPSSKQFIRRSGGPLPGANNFRGCLPQP